MLESQKRTEKKKNLRILKEIDAVRSIQPHAPLQSCVYLNSDGSTFTSLMNISRKDVTG